MAEALVVSRPADAEIVEQGEGFSSCKRITNQITNLILWNRTPETCLICEHYSFRMASEYQDILSIFRILFLTVVTNLKAAFTYIHSPVED